MILNNSFADTLPCVICAKTIIFLTKSALFATMDMSFRIINVSSTRVNATHQMDLAALSLFACMKLLTPQVSTLVTVAQA